MRPIRALAVVVVMCAGLLTPLDLAHSYAFLGHRWPNGATIRMELRVGSSSGALLDGLSSWNSSAADALAIWNGNLSPVGPFTWVSNSQAPIGEDNGTNDVFWDDTVYGQPFGANVLAITQSSWTGSTNTETDVVFNRGLCWNSYRGNLKTCTNGDPLYDFHRVALHEFGHVLGLDHPDKYGQVVTAQMNSLISNLDTLAADDIAGARALYPPPPPVITTQPTSRTITGCTSTTLTVFATSQLALSYQWYQGTSGNTSAPIAGATASSYTTPALCASTSYWVRVSNANGSVNSATATVTVLSPLPVISTQPVSQVTRRGRTATLSVVASGVGLSYQWQFSTNSGGSWTNVPDVVPYSGAKTSTLVVANAVLSLQYRAVVSNAFGSTPTQAASLIVTPAAPAFSDLDGDARADLTVYRPSTGYWYIKQSSNGYTGYGAYQWGISTDIPVAGDYDGDGRGDLAVYRPSTGYWYVQLSGTNSTYIAQQWGLSTDVPMPGDYDGDGKTDLGVYRPSTGFWYVQLSSTNYTTYIAKQWGLSTDVPVPGDYDGDGKTDLGVYRPSTGFWYVLLSGQNYTTYIAQQWGGTDVPVTGDYDGDGKADLAVFRPSTGYWYILLSSQNYTTYIAKQWGLSTDVPVPGDYDGDGEIDLVVYRPSTGHWYILYSSTNYTTYLDQQWGGSSDTPVLQPRALFKVP